VAKDKSGPVDRPASKSAPRGNFSRRHVTREAHDQAVAAYQAVHGPEARRKRAMERSHLRASRTPQQQLELLDQRLGNKQGAGKERQRLLRLIKA
jgi:hypothetical protein